MSEQQADWVESIEMFGHWGASAMEQWRAQVFWREWIERSDT